MSQRALVAAAVLVASSACVGTFDGSAMMSEAPVTPMGPKVELPPAVELPAAVACNGTSLGRSYRGFSGEVLDADRLALATGQDLARLRDGSDLQVQYEGHGIRITGVTRSDQQSFGVSNEHWYDKTEASFATVYRAYALAFKGCLNQMQKPQPYLTFDNGDFAVSPNSESAQRQCKAMGRVIWWREMDTEELGACVDYAAEVLELESDPKRQWAYVCASIAGSVGFLIY